MTRGAAGQVKAFTIIELLVVIAIVAIIATMLLPSLARSKEAARRAQCGSNMKQLLIAATVYSDDNRDRYPSQSADGVRVRINGGEGNNFYDHLEAYAGVSNLWLCASTKPKPGRVMSYHMNGLIVTTNGGASSEIRFPTRTLLLAETGQHTRFDEAYLRPTQTGDYAYDRPQENHGSGSNAGFVDGHILWFTDARWTSNSFQVAP